MTSLRLLPLLLVLGPAAVAAQQEPDPRWLPWLGCWQVGMIVEPGEPLLCVRPTPDPLGVEVATVVAGEVTFSRVLLADGQPHDLSAEGCAGPQVATFSADGQRVYLRSALTCDGGRRRTASAIMAMASPTVWLDAQSVGMDDERVPRALRYSPVPVASWPDEFRFPAGRGGAVDIAREMAADRLSLLDVREAALETDAEAVATFVIERNQRFDLTADALAALDEAAVPGAVIDALVAVSYPERFAVEQETPSPPADSGYRRPGGAGYDPYGWGWWDSGPCYRYAAYCAETPYRQFDYGFRRFETFPSTPVWFAGVSGTILVRDRTQRATAVSGQGYARGSGSGGSGSRIAQPRNGDGGSVAPSTSQSGGSTGSGSASPGGYSRGGGGSGSSSSGSSSGAAKPRGRN